MKRALIIAAAALVRRHRGTDWLGARPIVRASRDLMNNALIPSPSPGGRREQNTLDNLLPFSPREKGSGDEGKQSRASSAFCSRVAATGPFLCVAVLRLCRLSESEPADTAKTADEPAGPPSLG